ncbi:hypothetical protein ABK040_006929 [Willaertia magna]
MNETVPILSVVEEVNQVKFEDVNNNREDDRKVKVYFSRWFMLLIQAAHGFMASFYVTTFTSVTNSVLKFYKMSPAEGWKVTLTATVYLFVYPFGSAISAYVLKKKGVRFSIFISALFGFVGSWVRFFGFKSGSELYFWIAFVGCVITSPQAPFAVNSTTLFVRLWFPAGERTIATTISALFNVLGTAAMFGVGAAILGDVHEVNDYDMIILLGLEAAIASFLLIVTVIFFKEQPPTPPTVINSKSLNDLNVEEESFWGDLKKILTNYQFLILFTSFSFGYGSINTVVTELNSIVIPHGYSADQASYLGMSLIVCGIFGSLVFGAASDITKRYKLILSIVCICSIGFFVWFCVISIYEYDYSRFIMIMICFSFLGFFAVALIPVVLEMGSETTFPQPESYSGSFFMGGGNLCSVIFLFICEALKETAVDKKTGKVYVVSMQNGLWFCLATFVFGNLFGLLFNGRYKRLEYERMIKERDSGVGVINDK